MKIQDMLFLLVVVLLFLFKKPRLAAVLGIGSLLLSMPLFALWIFFTAEHLTWYAAAFIFLAIIFYIREEKRNAS